MNTLARLKSASTAPVTTPGQMQDALKVYRKANQSMKSPEERLAEIASIIEDADNRAALVDGPVSHVRDTLTDKEWRRIYKLASATKANRKKGQPREGK